METTDALSTIIGGTGTTTETPVDSGIMTTTINRTYITFEIPRKDALIIFSRRLSLIPDS
jgi:hypothetical protein